MTMVKISSDLKKILNQRTWRHVVHHHVGRVRKTNFATWTWSATATSAPALVLFQNKFGNVVVLHLCWKIF